MRRRLLRLLNLAAPAAIFLLALAFIDCGGVPFTAPTAAVLQISANPTAIPVVDGVSTITVLGFKSADDGGGPLPDGTQIFFTTNVGIIEERVEMQNGVARGFLRSNGRAGLAAVVASSGSVSAPLETPVLIGNATGINIVLTANPPTVGPPDFTSEILATAFDNDNNPMRDVPIIFSTNAGALASQGSIIRTNALGQALDRLALKNEPSATVTASSGSVSSNSVTVNRGAQSSPVISSVSPTFGLPGETLTVIVSGQNFQPGALLNFGDGIVVDSVHFVSSGTLEASITIDSGATLGFRTVTVTNPDGGTDTLANGFRVGTAPSIAPVITSVIPSSGTRGTTLNVTISGANFQSGAIADFGTGITVNSVTFISANQLQASITIAATATIGSRTVTVTNPDGGSGSLAGAFSVVSAGPAPVITSVNPASGNQGQTLNVTIFGTDFQSGAVVSFGAGVSVNSVIFVSANQLQANITISPAATAGSRNVTVINPDGGTGTLAGGFTVIAPPIVTAVTPPDGNRGAFIASVFLDGANFQSGASVSFGAGITVSMVVFISSSQLAADISISATAPLGPHDVTVTNPDGGTGTLVGGFTVNP